MKMKNITKYIFAAFVSTSLFASCNLELLPTTAIVYDENEPAIQSSDDIVSIYFGILAQYRSLCSGSFDITTDVMVDYFNATKGFGNNYGPVHRLDDSYTPSDDYVESFWASNYSAIKNYNVAIEQAAKVTDPELQPAAKYLAAVAHFCRASSYLTLTRLFGSVYDPATAEEELSVPLVKKYDVNYSPVRATVQDVYDFICEDLVYAEDIAVYDADIYNYLPSSQANLLPLTIDAVNAVWARYYLDVKDYAQAVTYATKVIDTGYYKLAASASDMQKEYTNDNGTEPIVQMFANYNEGTISKSIYTAVGYDEDNGKYFSPYFLPSQNLIDAYEPGDLRLSTWFSQTMYPVYMNGTFHDEIYTFVKYLGNPEFNMSAIENGAHTAKPIMISEMYLIAAEAAYMQNNAVSVASTKHLQAIQKARKATTTQGTLENIKNEWFKEMVGTGHRFVCLKRWGDPIGKRNIQPAALSNEVCHTGAAYDQREVPAGHYMFNFPIPSYEIKITPSLGQNDGYEIK